MSSSQRDLLTTSPSLICQNSDTVDASVEIWDHLDQVTNFMLDPPPVLPYTEDSSDGPPSLLAESQSAEAQQEHTLEQIERIEMSPCIEISPSRGEIQSTGSMDQSCNYTPAEKSVSHIAAEDAPRPHRREDLEETLMRIETHFKAEQAHRLALEATLSVVKRENDKLVDKIAVLEKERPAQVSHFLKSQVMQAVAEAQSAQSTVQAVVLALEKTLRTLEEKEQAASPPLKTRAESRKSVDHSRRRRPGEVSEHVVGGKNALAKKGFC